MTVTAAWIAPATEPDEQGARRAFEALVRARYALVERDAGLGDVATRMTIRPPDEDPRKFIEVKGPDERYVTITQTCFADAQNFSYDPDFINRYQPDELLFILASMAHRIRADCLHMIASRGSRDLRTVSAAIDLMSNAAIRARKIGRLPRDCLFDARVTPDMNLDAAYPIAAEVIAKLDRAPAPEIAP